MRVPNVQHFLLLHRWIGLPMITYIVWLRGSGYENQHKMVEEEMVVGALHSTTIGTRSRHQPL